MPNYLYNGIELPALPEWDKTKYPYAIITIAKSPSIGGIEYTQRKLTLLSSYQMGYNQVGNWAVNSVGDFQEYDYFTSNSEWTEADVNYADAKTPAVVNIKWANFDILNEDGSVYLAASDPVPVGGEPEQPTLTERDLYRKINGQPTKLTLYKKVGGELVALDEYSAVSAAAVQSNT